jgi:hypothetical protein
MYESRAEVYEVTDTGIIEIRLALDDSTNFNSHLNRHTRTYVRTYVRKKRRTVPVMYYCFVRTRVRTKEMRCRPNASTPVDTSSIGEVVRMMTITSQRHPWRYQLVDLLYSYCPL